MNMEMLVGFWWTRLTRIGINQHFCQKRNMSGNKLGDETMATGIWQGRFQYIHNGHYYIFKNELPQFEQKMVAIVNPNPSYPACSNFARFNDNRNPFNYFQRMLLWKKIADHEEMQIIIVPCWHARYKIELENDFLPMQDTRYWIIPITQDDAEEDKANDLRRKGEKIHSADFEKENAEYARINATMIRQNISQGNEIYKKYVPECIWTLTEELFLGVDKNRYFLVPFIDNKIDVYSIQSAIEAVNQYEGDSYILFTITVHVSDGEMEWKDENELPWWFKPARHPNGGKTFYKKAKLITELMEKLEITKYLITPIFIMSEDIDILSKYNCAFLPSVSNTKVIINQSFLERDFYKYNFISWLDNIELSDNVVYTSLDREIDKKMKEFFSQKHNNYVMDINDNKIYVVIKDVLIDNTREEIKRRVENLINKAHQDIENGGLTSSEKRHLMNLINDIYPKIKVDYLTMLNVLDLDFSNCNSDANVYVLKQKISELENRLQNALESTGSI